jgi:hypothetical protein
MCHKRSLGRQNERACFAGRVGGAGNPDFGALSADAPDSRVSWPHQSVLNINFGDRPGLRAASERPGRVNDRSALRQHRNGPDAKGENDFRRSSTAVN